MRDSPSGRDFGFILHLAKKLGWYEFVFDTAIQYHIILKTYCSSISSLVRIRNGSGFSIHIDSAV